MNFTQLTYNYPVRVCAAEFSVWFRPYVYLYVYLVYIYIYIYTSVRACYILYLLEDDELLMNPAHKTAKFRDSKRLVGSRFVSCTVSICCLENQLAGFSNVI